MSKFIVEYLIRGASYEGEHRYFDTIDKAKEHGYSLLIDDDSFEIAEVDDNGNVYNINKWWPGGRLFLHNVKVVFLNKDYAKFVRTDGK